VERPSYFPSTTTATTNESASPTRSSQKSGSCSTAQ
jgi:hypothetical protein